MRCGWETTWPAEEARSVSDHLRECGACRALVRELRDSQTLLAELRDEDLTQMGVAVRANVLERLERRNPPLWWRWPAVAAALLLVLAVFWKWPAPGPAPPPAIAVAVARVPHDVPQPSIARPCKSFAIYSRAKHCAPASRFQSALSRSCLLT